MTPEDRPGKIGDYFPTEKLWQWADEVENCQIDHNTLGLIPKVRAITTHPQFRALREQSVLAIPVTSSVDIEGVGEDIPRAVVMDIDLYAELMVFSRVITHGLTEPDLEILYKHHCLEPMIKYALAYRVSNHEAIQILKFRIDQLVLSLSSSTATP